MANSQGRRKARREATRNPAKPKITTVEILSAVVAVVGLVLGFVVAAPSAAGIIDITWARLLLAGAVMVAVIGALIIECLSGRSYKRIFVTTLVVAVISISAGFYGDYWIGKKKAEQDRIWLPSASSFEILYDPTDAATNRWLSTDCTRCSLHVHVVTVHNISGHRIDGVKLYLKGMLPQDVPNFRDLNLHPNLYDSKDDPQTKSDNQVEFALEKDGKQKFDVVYSDPMHPQQSYVQHTVLRVGELLPPVHHTLYLSVMVRGVEVHTEAFETEYTPKTGDLSFWKSGTAPPEPDPRCGAGQLELTMDLVPRHSTPTAGGQFGGYAYWQNNGAEPLSRVDSYSAAFVVEDLPGETVNEKDNRVRTLFAGEVDPQRKQYCAENDGETRKDVAIGLHSDPVLVVTRILNPSDIEGLKRHSTKIYLLSWLAWTGPKGMDSAWDCRWTYGQAERWRQTRWMPCERTES